MENFKATSAEVVDDILVLRCNEAVAIVPQHKTGQGSEWDMFVDNAHIQAAQALAREGKGIVFDASKDI